MLSKILSKETCKNCKFCCSFKRQSLWETPLFSLQQKNLLQNKYPFSKFKLVKDDVFTIDLDNSYKTHDQNCQIIYRYQRTSESRHARRCRSV